MIVWGGNQGAKYNPTFDTWTTITSASPGTQADSAVWTGTEILLWYGPGVSGERYNPSLDIWTTITTDQAPSNRSYYSFVWTGTEMIIWGGTPSIGHKPLNNGACYNPFLDTWRPITTTGAPSARWRHTAIWSGREMIVWGGCGGVYEDFALTTGARYNPLLDTWTPITTTGAPAARTRHGAVWTGTEMLVWGGRNAWSDGLNTGARYNPSTDTWAKTTDIGTPSGRAQHTIIWTGTEIVIWGGFAGTNQYYQTGARYTYPHIIPYWNATTLTNAPGIRAYHTAVWTVTTATPAGELIIWGGKDSFGSLNNGMRYQPLLDTWCYITPSDSNTPSARWGHTAIWTGTEMIIWGGYQAGEPDAPQHPLNTGARYNPVFDAWISITDTDPDIPEARGNHTAVWTGTPAEGGTGEMLIWGGLSLSGTALATGARYNPLLDDWTTITMTGAPISRYNHSAVWTGKEMIIWGGRGLSGTNFVALNTGARYNPVSDTWTAITESNAPWERWDHTAVWTGVEMVIWGGWRTGGTIFYDGARYNPVIDTWTSLSTTNTPDARHYHTAVWTGTEMLIWGGTDGIKSFNTGARYLPASDTWLAIPIPTQSVGTPAGRENHTTIWTGQEMVIWGGYDGYQYLNTGGRYKPR
jgi:hypothetical protein